MLPVTLTLSLPLIMMISVPFDIPVSHAGHTTLSVNVAVPIGQQLQVIPSVQIQLQIPLSLNLG
jgi:hypothetical protein